MKCDAADCDFTTAYEWAMRCHKNAKHTHSHYFQCKMCEYQTTTRSSLVRHHKMHLGMREYKCSLCAHTAVCKHEIVRHMRRHSKEKLYFCDRCEFSTSYCSGLKVHLMQHLGLKPWQCSLCGFNSITKQRVQQHQMSRHPNLKGDVINLGLKLDLKAGQFKRKAAECYTVKTVEELETDAETGGAPVAVTAGPEEVVEVDIQESFEVGQSYHARPLNVESGLEALSWQLDGSQGTRYHIQKLTDSSGETQTIIVQSAEGEDISQLQFVMGTEEISVDAANGEESVFNLGGI